MDNRELQKKIQEENAGKDLVPEDLEERIIKFLVFHIQNKKYAVYAEEVREIVMDVPLFYVPFVPPYIRGFINRHGEPYTVLDLNVLFEKETLSSETFLILNIASDQIAFLISDVLEIVKVPERSIHLLSSLDDQEGYFLGSITSGGNEVFIINFQSLQNRMENDLESS